MQDLLTNLLGFLLLGHVDGISRGFVSFQSFVEVVEVKGVKEVVC